MGAKIVITNSAFETSRFCKGMIVYKRRPILSDIADVMEVIDINELLAAAVDKSVIDI